MFEYFFQNHSKTRQKLKVEKKEPLQKGGRFLLKPFTPLNYHLQWESPDLNTEYIFKKGHFFHCHVGLLHNTLCIQILRFPDL